MHLHALSYFFFFNDTAPPEIYPLPLPAALPIGASALPAVCPKPGTTLSTPAGTPASTASSATRSAVRGDFSEGLRDRKSTRLNSSHSQISYAVFCLKKKNIYRDKTHRNSRRLHV